MQPSPMRLEPADEFPHAPDDAQNFNESVYVNAFDATQEIGGWLRLGNRVNEGHAELSVCLYLPDGRVACQFQRPSIAANDRFDAGGLRYTVIDPLGRIAVRYEGELMLFDDPTELRDPGAAMKSAPRVTAALTWELRALSPAHGGEPTQPEHVERMLYGPDFSRGHFNQHVAARGTIKVDQQHFELDGRGWRDHSWGPRYWQAIWAYRLFIANFEEGRGLMLLKRLLETGGSRRLGVLLVDGEYEEVLDLDVITRWSPQRDPLGASITVRTERRQEEIEARVITMVPLRNRREADGKQLLSRVAEGFTEFTWGASRGYGMTEYIERVEDDVPIGFPL